MIKKVLLAFAMLGMALQSVAQKVDLNKVKFIVVTTDGVNMRKAPNTNSAKLVTEWLTDGEGCDSRSYPVWSDTRKQKDYSRGPANPYTGQTLPVIGETSEWYKVIYWDFVEGSFVVYISKRFCHETSLVNWFSRNTYTVIHGGPYAGWTIIDNSDPENGDEYIIGRLVNGMMVYSASCTDKYSDLSNLLTNGLTTLTREQFNTLFKKRDKLLINYRTASAGEGTFEVDASSLPY